MPLKRHAEAMLAHELGHYMGLPHSDGCEGRFDASTPHTFSNAADVVDGDSLNVMSFSQQPASRQYFTYGQVQQMMLKMLELIG